MSELKGFTQSRLDTGEVTLSLHRAGRGAPLILLHGFPQNHRCWGRVAPELARHFHVIVPDLRGYGDSDAPRDDAAHATYSKRRMGADIRAVMDALGLERVHILGHDRGARVAYRLALDHPERVVRLGLIEILPTLIYWERFAELALPVWHWPFLAQPAPLPERLIGAEPRWFADHLLTSWTLDKSLAPFAPEALASYRAQFADPARLAAMCADYRAGAGPDRAHDEADRNAGKRIAAPLHFLWARSGFPARSGNDPAAIWRQWAENVTDSPCDSGHFVMEENPQAVLSAFLKHFSTG